MIIHDVIWLESVEDKIIGKHNVQPYEVEEALLNKPHVRFMEVGINREKIYMLPLAKPTVGVI